jgi:3-oxoacyl-[acyl-carrier protein] reductase
LARLTSLSRSIEGQVAIVTGAGSGMGRATAHLFADEGAAVVVAELGAERVAEVTDEISAAHGTERVLGVTVDVADAIAIRDLVEATVDRFGRLDIVVNNAGVSLVTSAFQDADSYEDHWRRTFDVNLTAQSRLIRAAVPHLQRAGAGRIVNIASTEAIVATGGLAAYTASKAGVVGLTKSFAVELGRFGITVNCICPGPIHTAMTVGIPAEAKDTYARRRVPMRRYGEPEEVAHMTLSLCLPSASFVNGAIIPVDGGMTIRHT